MNIASSKPADIPPGCISFPKWHILHFDKKNKAPNQPNDWLAKVGTSYSYTGMCSLFFISVYWQMCNRYIYPSIHLTYFGP